jgi:hypothetical protein
MKRYTCKCGPLSPFHWHGKAPQLDWGQLDRARASSEATSKVVDRNRANGIDIGHRMPGGITRNLDPKQFHVFSKA